MYDNTSLHGMSDGAEYSNWPGFQKLGGGGARSVVSEGGARSEVSGGGASSVDPKESVGERSIADKIWSMFPVLLGTWIIPLTKLLSAQCSSAALLHLNQNILLSI